MSWRSRPDGDLPAIIRESARTTRGDFLGAEILLASRVGRPALQERAARRHVQVRNGGVVHGTAQVGGGGDKSGER